MQSCTHISLGGFAIEWYYRLKLFTLFYFVRNARYENWRNEKKQQQRATWVWKYTICHDITYIIIVFNKRHYAHIDDH